MKTRHFALTLLYKDHRNDVCYHGMTWSTPVLNKAAFEDLFQQLGRQRNLPASAFVILNHLELEDES